MGAEGIKMEGDLTRDGNQVWVEASGMNFGPFHEDSFYHVEKCDINNGRDDVKIADLLALHSRSANATPLIWIIEAKSSAPRDYKAYIEEIHDKLNHAYCIYLALRLGLYQSVLALPTGLEAVPLSTTGFCFTLVIKGQGRKEELAPLRDALRQKLRKTLKLWGWYERNHKTKKTDEIIVLSGVMAKEEGLLS